MQCCSWLYLLLIYYVKNKNKKRIHKNTEEKRRVSFLRIQLYTLIEKMHNIVLYRCSKSCIYFEDKVYWHIALSTENRIIFPNKQNDYNTSYMDSYLFFFFSSINDTEGIWIINKSCLFFLLFLDEKNPINCLRHTIVL